MNLNEWRDAVHENAVDHGWYEEPPSFPEVIALCHSELSEALEEYRDGKPQIYFRCREVLDGGPSDNICNPADEYDCLNFEVRETCKYRNPKPEGAAVELIDCLIRILDYCGHAGIDVEKTMSIKHEYNKTRPWKHGGKIV